jgi:YHS domain-containing protein
MELLSGLTDILPWIFRIIVVLFVLRLIQNYFAPKPRRASSPRTGGRNTAVERAGGQLVRDPQCGTYVPLSTSVHLVSGPNTLYFCSVACRDAYRKAQSSVA